MNEYYDQEYRDVFGVDDTQPSLTGRIWLSWEDLKYKVPKHRGFPGISAPSDYQEKLTGTWGNAGPGEIVAILGEVRSGKSLILNILAGNLRIDRGDLLTGRVLVNGFKRAKDGDGFARKWHNQKKRISRTFNSWRTASISGSICFAGKLGSVETW